MTEGREGEGDNKVAGICLHSIALQCKVQHMTACPKNAPVRLKGAALRRLILEVFNRDNWTCQDCGTTHDLDRWPHHIRFGIHKEDKAENLVTLCRKCHAKRHRIKLIDRKEVNNAGPLGCYRCTSS